MKQETLEEFAKRYYPSYPDGIITDEIKALREGFMKGVEVQQERMYSEDEVIELLQKYRYDLSSGKTANIGDTTKFWFEQFKKK
jgi:hypothetical protein